MLLTAAPNAPPVSVHEFAFELSLCARLEADHEGIVARQLGGGVARPSGRIVDVVTVAPGPQFGDRAALTADAIPLAAIEADVGAGRFVPVKAAFDGPPERRREQAEAAVDAGFFEQRRHNGRLEVKQVARYPTDWFDTLVGIENKPDLDRPGDLEQQLRIDVGLGVFDRIVLATADHVTGAQLDRLPAPVGVWQYDGETIEVIREATALSTTAHGVELDTVYAGRTDIDIVTPAAKQRARRRIAERAYGKGWRTYALPGCANIDAADRHGTAGLPRCTYFDRIVNPASACGPSCAGHDPDEPPEVDLSAERAARSRWEPDPEGGRRRQSGLDRFG